MTESPVIDIVVREANANDFDFVADLMIRVLTPFYDGDHRAHARRIFETHMNGGIDRVGHFSAGQHMFIAEQALRQEKQLRIDKLLAEVVYDYCLLAKTRGMSRVAIDAIMVDDGFMADFSFDPSGKLEIDKVNFVALIERIIHGKE